MDDPVADLEVRMLGRPHSWDFIRRFAAVWTLTLELIDDVRGRNPGEWIMS